MRKAYSSILKDVVCFGCERYCVPYPPADSKFQKLLRFLRLDRVNRVKLSTYPMKRFFPLDIHFEMSVDEKQKEICFNHPVTGMKHTLYFQSPESMELPIDQNHNLYIMQSMYEIAPALPQGDTLQFGSSIQYTETPEISDDKFSPTSASSIGIIGGADGPTSIFMSSKGEGETVSCGLHGLPLHSCYSVPSFQKGETSNFILEGINTKDRNSEEYNFS